VQMKYGFCDFGDAFSATDARVDRVAVVTHRRCSCMGL
jgi:hypothetical protein